MSVYAGPKISTQGLVLMLDAGNPQSYPGSGTAWLDRSQSKLLTTLTNGPTYTTGYITLDATDDWVNIGTDNRVKIDQGDFTIITMLTWVSAMDLYGTFFYQSGDGDGNFTNKSIMFQRYYNNGQDQLTLNFYNGDGAPVGLGTVFTANSNHFLAVSFTRSTLANRFFRNGTFYSSTNVGPCSFSTLSSTQIGRRYRSSAAFSVKDLNARIYLTMVYTRALADAEITELYAQYGPRLGLI